MKKKKSKIVFISGSSSGLGYELAKEFSKKKYKVILNSNNERNLKQKYLNLDNCDYIKGDITKFNQIKNIVAKLKKKYGKIDFLICNYGSSNFKENNLDFRKAFDKNFFSTVHTVESFLPILKNNLSKIFCISSICGLEIIKGAPIGYSVAKSALNSYVKFMSYYLANRGITINGIAPGNLLFKGSLWQKKLNKNNKLTKKYIKENVPINKFGKPKDIFDIIYMIVNSGSNFYTGSTYIVDGGQSKKFF